MLSIYQGFIIQFFALGNAEMESNFMAERENPST